MKKKKYYFSTTGYDTLEECINQINAWKKEERYNDDTLIIEAKRIYKPVEKLEIVEMKGGNNAGSNN